MTEWAVSAELDYAIAYQRAISSLFCILRFSVGFDEVEDHSLAVLLCARAHSIHSCLRRTHPSIDHSMIEQCVYKMHQHYYCFAHYFYYYFCRYDDDVGERDVPTYYEFHTCVFILFFFCFVSTFIQSAAPLFTSSYFIIIIMFHRTERKGKKVEDEIRIIRL